MKTRRVILGATLALIVLSPGGGGTEDVGQRVLLDNAQITVMEFVFPPGFRGEEHAAVASEFAYGVEGEFAVVTRGQGKRVVRRGEIEWAPRGTVHYSLNERRIPARVLVVLLKERCAMRLVTYPKIPEPEATSMTGRTSSGWGCAAR